MYTDIISKNLCESAQMVNLDQFYFPKDNNPKHGSKLTKQEFTQNNKKY